MHNVFHLQTLWTKEEITLIFTALVWDKYKMIAYPVQCFIWRFYLTGLWMQLLCLSTRLAKLPEFINEQIVTVIIFSNYVKNSHKAIPEVCLKLHWQLSTLSWKQKWKGSKWVHLQHVTTYFYLEPPAFLMFCLALNATLMNLYINRSQVV